MGMDSIITSPSAETRIGDLPIGWMLSSSGGARWVFGFRRWFTRVYSKPYATLSSSQSQRIRCDWEFCARSVSLVVLGIGYQQG